MCNIKANVYPQQPSQHIAIKNHYVLYLFSLSVILQNLEKLMLFSMSSENYPVCLLSTRCYYLMPALTHLIFIFIYSLIC